MHGLQLVAILPVAFIMSPSPSKSSLSSAQLPLFTTTVEPVLVLEVPRNSPRDREIPFPFPFLLFLPANTKIIPDYYGNLRKVHGCLRTITIMLLLKNQHPVLIKAQ